MEKVLAKLLKMIKIITPRFQEEKKIYTSIGGQN